MGTVLFQGVYLHRPYSKYLCKIIPWKYIGCRTTPQCSFVLLWNLFGSIVPRSSCAAGNYCTKCNTREPWLFWYPQVSSVSTACIVLRGNVLSTRGLEINRNMTRWRTCSSQVMWKTAHCISIHTILFVHAFLPLKTLINSLCIYCSIFVQDGC